MLRNFRDLDVLKTSAGANFLVVFNAFYYSFSPRIATFIGSESFVRVGMKVTLYPLVGILYLSSLIFAATSFNSEIAVALAGIFASFGIGAIYFGIILAITLRIFGSRWTTRYPRAIKVTSTFAFVSIIGLYLGEFFQLAGVLEITSVGLVLSCMAMGGLLASWNLLHIFSERELG
jgi:hypothetical protein